MLRPEDATKESLIVSPNWEIEGMYSCCSAEVVIRLEASYLTPEEYKEGAALARKEQWSMKHIDGRKCWLDQIIDSCNSAWDAIPLDIAFGAVLQDMLACGHKTLFMCTDNTTVPETGDVHKGPFSTKRLAFWLEEQEVCKQFIQGADTGQCSVWSWQLNKTKAYALRNKLSRQYNKRYNKLADSLPDPTPYPFSSEGCRW